jgi:8-oxo-dGTP diphosphatase
MNKPKTVTCLDIDRNEHEVLVTELKWRPAAYGIVIHEGKILLCNHFGRKNLPGGGVELGELSEDAVLREIKEETGIIATKPKLLGVTNTFFKSPDTPEYYHSILMYYACEYVGGELSVDGFDDYEKAYAELAEWTDVNTIEDWQITSSVDYRPYVKQALKLA